MRKIKFDTCIVGTGKARIDFSAKLAKKSDLKQITKEERNLITIDLNNCKNWNECQKVIDNIISNRVKINIKQIKN